jgi:hypothetical protein
VIPVIGEGERAEWEICEIMDRRTRRAGKFEYLCRYKGYPLLQDCQWRPEAELEELARNMLTEFQDVYSTLIGQALVLLSLSAAPVLDVRFCEWSDKIRNSGCG